MKGVMYWSKPITGPWEILDYILDPWPLIRPNVPQILDTLMTKSLIHRNHDSNIRGIHLKESPSAVISLMIIFFFLDASLKSFRVWSGMLFLSLHSLWRIRHQSESQGDTNFYQWLDFYVHVGFSSLNGTHLLENSKYDCYGEKGLYALTV